MFYFSLMNSHLRSFKSGIKRDDYEYPSFFLGKTFQNLKVSSPAPVTIVYPSGDIDKYKTLYVCPVKSAIFSKEGYFQMTI